MAGPSRVLLDVGPRRHHLPAGPFNGDVRELGRPRTLFSFGRRCWAARDPPQ